MFWNEKIECMPREDLKKLQYESLVKLVAGLYENNQFYHDRMVEHNVKPEDIKSLDDIVKLPFMYKQDLRDNYPTGLFTVQPKDVVRYHVSSGTTGKPTLVGYTRHDLDYWTETLARSLTSIGLGPDDIIQVSYGYGLFTGGLGLHYGVEKIGATVLPSGTGGTERQLELMQDLGVTAIACTPSYLVHMAEVAEKMGIDFRRDTKLRIAILGAEPWSEGMRKHIEEATGVKAYDIYGMSEMAGPMYTECPECHGIHIPADMMICEIIDPETDQPVKPGETGELVVTMLQKEAFPLVRYKVHDLTSIDYSPCPCGRTSPRIARISGRSDDMLIVRGINVFPSQVEHALMQVPEVNGQYMIVLNREGALDRMTVQVEIRPEAFSDKMEDMLKLKKSIEYEMKKYLNISVEVELKDHGSLPRFQGKAKRVIDNRVI